MKERELPEGWEWKRLGDILKECYRYPTYFGIEYKSNGIPEVRGELLLKNGKISLDTTKYRYISKETADQFPRVKLEDGDLVLSVRGTIGKIGYVPNELEGGVITANLIRLSPLKKKVDSNYLKIFLLTKKFQKYLNSQCSSTTIKTIQAPVIKSLKIPLPPLPIQRQIVAVLEKAEAVKRQRLEADALTGALLQSVFLKMFGDPVKNEMRWEQSKLGDCCRVQRGKFTHRPRNEPRFYGGNYPFIQTGDVANCQGKLKKYTQTLNDEGLSISKMFPKGTIVISIAANIGDTAILDFDSCFPDSVVGISPDDRKGTVEFFEMMLRFFKEHLWNLAPETAQRNINLRILSELEVIIPPLALQQQFARVVEEVERIRQQQVASDRQIEGLCEGLMQRAFAGELTVV